MSRDLAKRELRFALQRARAGVAEASREAASVVYWLRKARRALVCFVRGRHRFGPWRESTTVFVPPEQRWCKRCGATEYRGGWPAVRVVSGSMAQATAQYEWCEEFLRTDRPE